MNIRDIKVWDFSNQTKKELKEFVDSIKINENKLNKIRRIAEEWNVPVKKICGNCKKYDGCHACCEKDIDYYKYTNYRNKACKDFTYLDKYGINILARQIIDVVEGG